LPSLLIPPSKPHLSPPVIRLRLFQNFILKENDFG
jgi:hypothetical protein